jgi:hypothetical protein
VSQYRINLSKTWIWTIYITLIKRSILSLGRDHSCTIIQSNTTINLNWNSLSKSSNLSNSSSCSLLNKRFNMVSSHSNCSNHSQSKTTIVVKICIRLCLLNNSSKCSSNNGHNSNPNNKTLLLNSHNPKRAISSSNNRLSRRCNNKYSILNSSNNPNNSNKLNKLFHQLFLNNNQFQNHKLNSNNIMISNTTSNNWSVCCNKNNKLCRIKELLNPRFSSNKISFLSSSLLHRVSLVEFRLNHKHHCWSQTSLSLKCLKN